MHQGKGGQYGTRVDEHVSHDVPARDCWVVDGNPERKLVDDCSGQCLCAEYERFGKHWIGQEGHRIDVDVIDSAERRLR